MGSNLELIEEPLTLILDDDLIKHHPSPPHSSADREFPLDEGNLKAMLGEKIRADETGGPPSDDRHINSEVLFQFLEVSVKNGLGNDFFIQRHDFLLRLPVSSLRAGKQKVRPQETAGK